MAVYENSEFVTPRNPSMVSIAAYSFANFMAQTMTDLRHYIVRSQTERALSKLSNRQLKDIGIPRSKIAEFITGKSNHGNDISFGDL